MKKFPNPKDFVVSEETLPKDLKKLLPKRKMQFNPSPLKKVYIAPKTLMSGGASVIQIRPFLLKIASRS